MKESYGTLSETINGLKKEGYTLDFNDKIFRFEGQSNPDDQSILYAISSKKFNVKGTLVNGYGIYADDVTTALVAKLQQHL